MIIYSSLAAALFCLVTSLSGYAHWGTSTWWQGAAAGFVLALVWNANRTIPKFMLVVGVGMLLFVAFGGAEGLQSNSRGFFNGMSLFMVLGFVVSGWWRWKSIRPTLVIIAKYENVRWLLRLMGERAD